MRSTFTDLQKEEYESLVMRLHEAGAKNPSSWASSEVAEGIPQFASIRYRKIDRRQYRYGL